MRLVWRSVRIGQRKGTLGTANWRVSGLPSRLPCSNGTGGSSHEKVSRTRSISWPRHAVGYTQASTPGVQPGSIDWMAFEGRNRCAGRRGVDAELRQGKRKRTRGDSSIWQDLDAHAGTIATTDIEGQSRSETGRTLGTGGSGPFQRTRPVSTCWTEPCRPDIGQEMDGIYSAGATKCFAMADVDRLIVLIPDRRGGRYAIRSRTCVMRCPEDSMDRVLCDQSTGRRAGGCRPAVAGEIRYSTSRRTT